MSLTFDGARLANPYLTPEHERWRTQLRRFIENEIEPFAEQWDENGNIPLELWQKVAEQGILAIGYPEQYGGLSEGLDIWHSHIVHEELARIGVGGLTAALMVHSISLPTVLNLATESIKQQVGPSVLAGEKTHIARSNRTQWRQ